jgi:hypothetical protein
MSFATWYWRGVSWSIVLGAICFGAAANVLLDTIAFEIREAPTSGVRDDQGKVGAASLSPSESISTLIATNHSSDWTFGIYPLSSGCRSAENCQ